MEDKFNIYVNGVRIPYPDTFDIEMQEISGSDDGRTLDATMDKNSQGFVYYLILDYEWLLSHRVARLSCIKKDTYVDVTFFNPHENRVITQKMFTGNPTASHVGWGGRNMDIPIYSYHIEFTNKATRKQSEIPDIEEISEDDTQ